MSGTTRGAAMLLAVLFIPLLVSIGASGAEEEVSSIRLEADEGYPKTPAPNSFPMLSAIPGDTVTFSIYVINDISSEQTVSLEITDSSPGWLAFSEGPVTVTGSNHTETFVTVQVPDEYPEPAMDPTIDHMFRLEGRAEPSGDTAQLILVVRIEAIIDHSLTVLPEGGDRVDRDVYPGQNLFIDLELRNDGGLKDRYEISIDDHQTGWEITFWDGSTTIRYDLEHGDHSSAVRPRMLIGVSPKAALGSVQEIKLRTDSLANDMFDSGTVSRVATIKFHIVASSVITVRPITPYNEIREGEEIILDSDVINSGIGEGIFIPRVTVVKDGSPQMGWDGLFNPEGPLLLEIGQVVRMKLKLIPPEGATGLFEVRLGGFNQKGEVIEGESSFRIKPRSNVSIQSVEGGPFEKTDDINVLMIIGNGGFVAQTATIEIIGVPQCYSINITPATFQVGPGRSQMIIVSLDTREGFSPSSFTLTARLLIPAPDAGWMVADTYEHHVSINELPDLSVLDLTVPTRQLEEGERIGFNVTYGNTGPLEVSSAYLILYEVTFGFSRVEIERFPVNLSPGEKMNIWVNWTARPSAKSIRAVLMLPPGIEDDDPEDNEFSRDIHVIQGRDPESGDSGNAIFQTGMAISGIAAGTVFLAGIFAFVWSSDALRYSLLTAGMPMYSKLRPEHLLGNKLRRRIYVYVQNHPGEHFRSILVNLNLKNGTLAHHLYTLEKENLIRSHRDGLYRRFYPAGFKIDDSPLDLTPIQRRILEMISRRPGISQKEISEEMDLSTSTVNYNIKVIREKRLLNIRREGKFTKLYAAQDT